MPQRHESIKKKHHSSEYAKGYHSSKRAKQLRGLSSNSEHNSHAVDRGSTNRKHRRIFYYEESSDSALSNESLSPRKQTGHYRSLGNYVNGKEERYRKKNVLCLRRRRSESSNSRCNETQRRKEKIKDDFPIDRSSKIGRSKKLEQKRRETENVKMYGSSLGDSPKQARRQNYVRLAERCYNEPKRSLCRLPEGSTHNGSNDLTLGSVRNRHFATPKLQIDPYYGHSWKYELSENVEDYKAQKEVNNSLLNVKGNRNILCSQEMKQVSSVRDIESTTPPTLDPLFCEERELIIVKLKSAYREPILKISDVVRVENQPFQSSQLHVFILLHRKGVDALHCQIGLSLLKRIGRSDYRLWDEIYQTFEELMAYPTIADKDSPNGTFIMAVAKVLKITNPRWNSDLVVDLGEFCIVHHLERFSDSTLRRIDALINADPKHPDILSSIANCVTPGGLSEVLNNLEKSSPNQFLPLIRKETLKEYDKVRSRRSSHSNVRADVENKRLTMDFYYETPPIFQDERQVSTFQYRIRHLKQQEEAAIAAASVTTTTTTTVSSIRNRSFTEDQVEDNTVITYWGQSTTNIAVTKSPLSPVSNPLDFQIDQRTLNTTVTSTPINDFNTTKLHSLISSYNKTPLASNSASQLSAIRVKEQPCSTLNSMSVNQQSLIAPEVGIPKRASGGCLNSFKGDMEFSVDRDPNTHFSEKRLDCELTITEGDYKSIKKEGSDHRDTSVVPIDSSFALDGHEECHRSNTKCYQETTDTGLENIKANEINEEAIVIDERKSYQRCASESVTVTQSASSSSSLQTTVKCNNGRHPRVSNEHEKFKLPTDFDSSGINDISKTPCSSVPKYSLSLPNNEREALHAAFIGSRMTVFDHYIHLVNNCLICPTFSDDPYYWKKNGVRSGDAIKMKCLVHQLLRDTKSQPRSSSISFNTIERPILSSLWCRVNSELPLLFKYNGFLHQSLSDFYISHLENSNISLRMFADPELLLWISDGISSEHLGRLIKAAKSLE